ncbi:hypothetical protein [Paenibacillus massiliensis]|uniref:hypothetical protein n=1 Tax=Paenibacillus massiliensis TaxID=225917 RepID=UPI00046FA144|nr:hypothetical protein [Paenibacillus massiliensis]
MEPWIMIALLGLALMLYAWMLPRNQNAQASDEKVLSNVEATLEQYMADIEHGNDELIEIVTQIKSEHAAKNAALQEQVVELRQRVMDLERTGSEPVELSKQAADFIQFQERQAANLVVAEQEAAITEEAVLQAEESEVAVPETRPSIRDRYPELFALHGQGKSVDFIVKQTGIQRGEVQLILQLAEQEDQHD